MMKYIACLAALAGAGCGPSASDARDFQKGLEAAAGVDDEELKRRLLVASCGEVSSCGAGCQRAFAALSELPPDQQAAVLGAGCGPFRAFVEAHGRSSHAVADFEREYLRQFAGRAARALDGAERERFEALVGRALAGGPALLPGGR